MLSEQTWLLGTYLLVLSEMTVDLHVTLHSSHVSSTRVPFTEAQVSRLRQVHQQSVPTPSRGELLVQLNVQPRMT